MILGYSAQQVRDAEEPHIAAGEPLMARAAAGLAAVIREVAPPGGTVVAIIGPGNNGGDALFAGAALASEGFRMTLVPTSARMHSDGLAAALGAGATLLSEDAAPVDVAAVAAGADVLVDGILGTGTSAEPALRGRARELVAAILTAMDPRHPLVVAVDIPSGIDPTDGRVPDAVMLPANITVTFGGIKAGLLTEPARSLAGELRLVPVGIEAALAAMPPLVRLPD